LACKHSSEKRAPNQTACLMMQGGTEGAQTRSSSVERKRATVLVTEPSAALRLSALLYRCSLLGCEFERQADHGSLLTRRSVGSVERLRNLGDRLLAGHGFEDTNIVL